MHLHDALARIHEIGVVPIIRAPSPEHALRIADALLDGDLPTIEVTFTVPGALEVLRDLRRRAPGILLGAGTVLDGETARAAILEGADFLVSVVAPPDVMATAHRYSVLAIPGAYTPQEIMNAVAMGASVVKVFPAEIGGPAYLRALRGPLPQVRLFPTGGVSAANVKEWFDAGAFAVGVGSALIGDVLKTEDYRGLTARAREMMAAVRQGRTGLPAG
ncbi:MAG: bifunctional 4-hydroxy-2-oxoglutarate aldolase/2-dehydro-3-deoxy-phosphogluconate aldolase [Armatimonadetes bacterium]|nr:bifunctional 4-hydroxy-2-oxoglutarate aldolase/2-dehydro-3-deoxy-phosphogluconate aldolase [Armatimonadota bacterium]